MVLPHEDFPFTAQDLVLLTENEKDGMEQFEKLGRTEGILKGLQSDAERGITGEDSAVRKEKYGENVLPQAPETSFITLYFRALQDTTIIILLICAVISLFLGIFFPPEGEEGTAWIEGAAIMAAVVIVTLVTSLNEYSQEKQFRKLNQRAEDRSVIVVRNSKQVQVNISEIVVGDLCVLNTGDRTPCDGIIVFSNDLKMDESNMTGESNSVLKDVNKRWRVLCGFQVTDGTGLFLATAVGPNTLWGKTVAQLSTPPEPTPLQEKLDGVAKTIGLIGTGAAVIVFVILVIYYLIDLGKPDYYFDWSQMNRVMDAFILSVTIVVVAVPEGLPLAVTISLAYSMKYMVQDNNLVRKLAACETLGGATDICSDKTGTLTLNQMTVMRAWIAGEEFDDMHSVQVTPALKTLLEESISINTTVITKVEKGKKEYIGNKTEGALLGFQELLGSADYDYIRKKNRIIRSLPFNSIRKKMFSIVKRGNSYRLYCKGAPERIISDCIGIIDPEGNQHELSDEGKIHITKIVDRFANIGYRTLCMAYKDLSENDLDQDLEYLDRDMYIISVFGIEDPVRPEVPLAVKQCQNAGVYVRMVTGDNIHTASVIARRCKILKDNGVAVEGPEFSKMTDEEIDKLLPSLQVLARSSPLDKLRLVQRLRANQHVVGVTGDGTNDAAALKEADVGLAMGIAGTEVAKQAADIIILDDNFRSIVLAIMWGRCIFDNICKFLQFQLTVNVVAVIIAVIGALGFQASPLTAVQLLWVNLIMDSLAALALGTERPTPDLLDRHPVNLKKAWILSNSMLKHIAGQSIYQIFVLLIVLYFGVPLFNYFNLGYTGRHYEHYTLIFNAFVFCQIFNIFNCRIISDREFNLLKGIHKNYFYAAVVIFIVIVQIIIVSFGGEVFQTTYINFKMWIASIIIGVVSIPLGLFLRLLRVPKKDGCGSGYSRKFDPEEEYLLESSAV